MYCFTRLDYIKYGLLGMACAFSLFFLFYDHLYVSLAGSLMGLFFIKWIKYYQYQKFSYQKKKQFKECLYALNASIQVGKSIENAFEMALKDLYLIYGENDFIMVQLRNILSKLMINVPIEKALYEFALEADDEDIFNFAMIFISARKAGGNLTEVMQSTSQVIHDKLVFVENIHLLVSGKRYEHYMMMLLLPLFLLYLKFNAYDFMEVMYTTLPGRLVMTTSLLLYILSFYIGYKIVTIEV